MEDSPYSTIKASLSSVSAKALNFSSRQILANYLDCTQGFVSEKGILRDYRGLAELVGLTYTEIQRIQEFENRTMKILESWEIRPAATLDKLISFLEDMGRHDVIEILVPLLEKNASSYLKYQNFIQIPIQVPEVTSGAPILSCRSDAITFDDLINRGSTVYDAFLSYAEEDTEIARQFADVLESSRIGIKLCMSLRDILGGCLTLDAEIELIKNRCRHMLILLTPNFLNSPALEFQVSFASSIAIQQRQRILVPVVLEPCEIPPIINTVSKIDFTKPHTKDWMMIKLITSLMHEEKARNFLYSIEQNPLITPNFILNSVSSEAANGVPVIMFQESASSEAANGVPVVTFPESAKHSLCSMENCSSAGPINALDNDNNDSDTCNFLNDSIEISPEMNEPELSPSKTTSKFRQFFSRSKKKGMISSFSNASLSSASSGFHSQTSNSMENLESASGFSYDSTIL